MFNNSFLTDVIAIIVIMAINSFFVISEIAVLTAAKPKLHKMLHKGTLGSKQAIKLTQQPELFLSTVQIGITLMSLLLGVFGGTTITGHVSSLLHDIPYLAAYSHVIGYSLSILVITYFTVLSEIVPKRIAMLNPEKIAARVSYGMYFFITLLYPLIWVLTRSTKFLIQIFRIKNNDAHVSVEEIKFLINQAENSGTLDKTERDMIKRLVNLSDMQVGAIMTPRNKIISLDLSNSEQVNVNKLKQHQFNYFPVINGELNNLIGIIPIKKLFNKLTITNSNLEEIAGQFQVLYIPEVAKVTKLIELFKEKQTKIAIVLDEYGDIEGLVTFNDILKTFVGDIAILMEGKKPGIIRKKDGSYIVDGNILIEEIMEQLHLTSLPGEEDEDYRTLASFILKQLGTIPRTGDTFQAMGWEFKVVKMDKFRIDRVQIKQFSIKDENDSHF